MSQGSVATQRLRYCDLKNVGLKRYYTNLMPNLKLKEFQTSAFGEVMDSQSSTVRFIRFTFDLPPWDLREIFGQMLKYG